LEDAVNEVDQAIWGFMKDAQTDIPDLESQTRVESVVLSVFGLFRSSGDEFI
jgi:hypothetical protein